jgi:hypothetical protein
VKKDMNKKGVGAIELLVGLIILVVIGIGVGGSLISSDTSLVSVSNETLTMTTTPAGAGGYNNTVSLAHEPVVAGSEVVRIPGFLLVRDANYSIDNKDATITSITNLTKNTAINVTYQYEPSGYVHSSTARMIVTLIIVFLAIGALLMVTKEVGLGA